MTVERVATPDALIALADGDTSAQMRLAAGLRERPLIYRCGGWAAVLVPRGANAWTLGRRIIVRASLWNESQSRRVALLAHECVHVAQWHETSRICFMVAYVRPYLSARLRGSRHWDAYRSVPAEDEAFAVEARLREILESA